MRNGSSIIDLTPLIHRTGGYEAYDESEDEENAEGYPDFYINICQPLNPMHGVACPAGSAICKVPVDGNPIVSGLAGFPGSGLSAASGPLRRSCRPEVHRTFSRARGKGLLASRLTRTLVPR